MCRIKVSSNHIIHSRFHLSHFPFSSYSSFFVNWHKQLTENDFSNISAWEREVKVLTSWFEKENVSEWELEIWLEEQGYVLEFDSVPWQVKEEIRQRPPKLCQWRIWRNKLLSTNSTKWKFRWTCCYLPY